VIFPLNSIPSSSANTAFAESSRFPFAGKFLPTSTYVNYVPRTRFPWHARKQAGPALSPYRRGRGGKPRHRNGMAQKINVPTGSPGVTTSLEINPHCATSISTRPKLFRPTKPQFILEVTVRRRVNQSRTGKERRARGIDPVIDEVAQARVDAFL